jgi:RNA-directed DNA polymerase
VTQAKPFVISKQLVWEAYKRVKANQGAAGVDSETVERFESNLKNNLYKVWNRMSSGTYFPPPVRTVAIPKKDGGERTLGIPTVEDRIAQTVVAMYLEPLVEPHFHPDSYGYRPKKSALQAVGVARGRCWRFDWIVDLDIQGFFDNLDHALVMRAVGKYTDCRWVHLYIERWLKAPAQSKDGTLTARAKGTPQGGVASPLLANIFLHLALDDWMRKTHPEVPFERYADDVIAHCESEEQAQAVKRSIEARLRRCKLELHPEKTKIVYCKDDDRRGSYPNEKFDFLGYTFRARRSKNRWGKYFINFSPAVSNQAATKMRREMRRWRLHLRSDKALDDLAHMWNPVLRGWINYYGRFYKSALHPVFRHLNRTLIRWASRKHKRLRGHQRRAEYWLGGVARREPRMFAHWQLLGLKPTAG